MKTVYDYFIDFANSLLKDTKDYDSEKLQKGICCYLQELDVCHITENAQKIAERESIRFSGMTTHTFIAFFETFSIRTRIVQLEKECELLAIIRLQEKKQISNEVYSIKLNSFYEMASGIVNDKRYTSWLDDMTQHIITCLKFASGQTDEINEEIIVKSIINYLGNCETN